jgi:hypothetical protein
MKRIGCILVLLILASASIAAQAQNRALFFEGRSVNQEQQTFFMDNFKMEAEALGYTVVDRRENAGYTFKFEVSPNLVLYSDGTMAMAPPDEDQFIIQITMISNEDSVDMASFSFGFTNLYDMYNYTQFLVVKGVVYIPAAEENIIVQEIVQGTVEDYSWRNKWVYIRASLDAPINFYLLTGDDHIYKTETAYKNKERNDNSAQRAHLYNLRPGLTVGVEVQFLNFMSVEPKIQVGWENLYGPGQDFYTLTAGLDIKFPLKFIGNVMLEPYVSASYPLYFLYPKDEVFPDPLGLGVGGGLQLGVKLGPGAFFIDASVMYLMDEVRINNLNPNYKYPAITSFQRWSIRIGAGYKFGLFDRG